MKKFDSDIDLSSMKDITDYREIPWNLICWRNVNLASMAEEQYRIDNGDAPSRDVIDPILRSALSGPDRVMWLNAIAERVPSDETAMVTLMADSLERILKANSDSSGLLFRIYDPAYGIWMEEGGEPLSTGKTVLSIVMDMVTDFVRSCEQACNLLRVMVDIAAPNAGPRPPAAAGAAAVSAWQVLADARKAAEGSVSRIERFVGAVLDGRYRNVLQGLRSRLSVPVTTWDTNTRWIVAEDGAIDLSTISLGGSASMVDHHPEAMTTFRVTASLLASVLNDGISEWEKGIKKVLPDEKVRVYLQKRYGAALLRRPGSVGKSLVWQFGMGDTAKSTVQECIAGRNGVFAPYAITTDSTVLTRAGERTGASDRFKAYARGKCFALINELDDGDKLSQSVLKSLTGGDTVTGTAKYANAVEYSFTATMFVSSNHPPMLPLGDTAAAKRIHVVPFTHKLYVRSKNPEEWAAAPEEHRADENWIDKVLADPIERSAILVWVLDGLTLFVRDGLGDLPDVMVQANEEFTAEADPVATMVRSLLGEEGFEDRPWIKVYSDLEWEQYGFEYNDMLTVRQFENLLTIRANELRMVKVGEEVPISFMRSAKHMLNELGGKKKKIRVDGKTVWAYSRVRVQPGILAIMGGVQA